MQEHQECPHGKQALAQNLVGPIQAVLGLIGIVAKAADRLAYGVGQRMGARPVQDVPQQVAAQQPAHREPQMISTKPAMSHRAARPTASTTSSTISPVVPTGRCACPVSVSKKARAISPGSSGDRLHHAPQHRVEQVEPGRVAGHFHQVAPGWSGFMGRPPPWRPAATRQSARWGRRRGQAAARARAPARPPGPGCRRRRRSWPAGAPR